jgi:hypothetical protein
MLRYLVRLPIGPLAPTLAAHDLVREVGNGWVEITDRLLAADDDDWVPVQIDLLGSPHRAELLVYGELRATLSEGDLIRSQPIPHATYDYWLAAGGVAYRAFTVEPDTPA